MSELNILKGEVRENTGKSFTKSVRKEGNIPCIVYGDEKDPVAVNINYVSALKLYNTGRMLTTLLDLELSNGDKMKVIPKDIQIDPVKDNIIHIDLLRLSGDSRVSVEIQVNFVGESDSPGIKSGGVLTVTRYSVELDCPALSIPESIDVNISNLEMGESVKLSDVNLPEDVNPVITDRDITIASVTAPVEEIEEEIIEDQPIEVAEETVEEEIIQEEVIEEELVVDTGEEKHGSFVTDEGTRTHDQELELARMESTKYKEENEELLKRIKELQNENKNFANAVLVLNEKVQESILSNAKLLFSNKTLGDASLNERQKYKIVES